jgi:hypothetical protein
MKKIPLFVPRGQRIEAKYYNRIRIKKLPVVANKEKRQENGENTPQFFNNILQRFTNAA